MKQSILLTYLVHDACRREEAYSKSCSKTSNLWPICFGRKWFREGRRAGGVGQTLGLEEGATHS